VAASVAKKVADAAIAKASRKTPAKVKTSKEAKARATEARQPNVKGMTLNEILKFQQGRPAKGGTKQSLTELVRMAQS
jgi:hypothetical protein